MEKVNLTEKLGISHDEVVRELDELSEIEKQRKEYLKALTDLIDQRIDERLKELAKAKQAENQKRTDEWIEPYFES